MPISSSERAPRTTRSSPSSSMRFSQSRRSRKVRVGRSATAIPLSHPAGARPGSSSTPSAVRRGQLANGYTTGTGALAMGRRDLPQETPVERAFDEGIVDDLGRVDGLHPLLEPSDGVLGRGQLGP